MVLVSVPVRGATLALAESFLRSKWSWVLGSRAKAMAASRASETPITGEDITRLETVLAELNAKWSVALGERGVAWRVRRVKTYWGLCNWRKRVITYNLELARADRELIEYVVVHEYTHFAVHNHGPGFHALMDARLPGWKSLRAALHARKFKSSGENRPAGCGESRVSPEA